MMPCRKINKLLVLLLFASVSLALCAQTQQGCADKHRRQRLDLSGTWGFAFDRDSTGWQQGFATKPLADHVTLPGTTDTNRKGDPLTDTTVTTRLSRPYAYFGKAWYQREVVIPKDWKKQRISLFLERTKPTAVFVDGKEVGRCDDVSVPHVYDLSDFLSPGKHTLAVMVDNGNSVPKPLLGSSHAYAEDTQTNWNGIIGQMFLEARNCEMSIATLRTMPDDDLHKLHIELTIEGKLKKDTRIKVEAIPTRGATAAQAAVSQIVPASSLSRQMAADGSTVLTMTIDLGAQAAQWSEFHPHTYLLRVEAEDGKGKVYDSQETVAGLRTFEARGHHFYVNGSQTFLRGKHDACVFPLTGHVAMDVDSWLRYLQICKDYGINHVRFHSWCPPEACFEAADQVGIYLQPELPIWGSMDENDAYLLSYLKDEGRKIIASYGNHPSFVMMGLGNELWGSAEVMDDFVRDFRAVDALKDSVRHAAYPKGGRRLYTFGSNMYLGYNGYFDGMDYFTTCRIGGEAWGSYNTHVRGSFAFCDAFDGGIINHEYPNTTTNFEAAIGDCPMPIVSHETGQFQMYPDFNEIKKYTGALKPYNMEVFRSRLQQAGMGAQAEQLHMASGKWAVQLYKADIEMDLRTRNMAGFQLLDIQDYPGQGSAYVGILDAFMEKKGLGNGLVTSEEWRGWCAPVVLLAELPKLTYNDGDTIRWNMLIANYAENSAALSGKTFEWAVYGDDERLMASGSQALTDVKSGVNSLNEAAKPFAAVAQLADKNRAEQLRLELRMAGTDCVNRYDLWAYPTMDYAAEKARLSEGVVVADSLTDDLLITLEKGGKVLLMPHREMYAEQTVGGLVQTDYWNYRMFKTISENNKKPVSPGTLGLLINDAAHPLVQRIPTGGDCHSSWQWAATAHNARPLVMDVMQEGYCPLVQVIDNVERNHRLGLVFEFAVGKGRLLVCMSDLRQIEQYPEVRHLYLSMLSYMQSHGFKPADQCTSATLKSLFSTRAAETNILELRNISYD